MTNLVSSSIQVSLQDFKTLVQNVFPFDNQDKLNNEDRADLEEAQTQVHELFMAQQEYLIANLNRLPLNNLLTFNDLNQSLKHCKTKVSEKFRNSLHTVSGLAEILKDNDDNEIQNKIKKLRDTDFLSSNALNLSEIQLPRDFNQILAIKNSDLICMITAGIIERDNLPLALLDLDQEQFIELARYLTYCDCKNFFNNSQWSLDKIDRFLEAVSPSVKTLLINSDQITNLPPLPKCEKLDISDCNQLAELPALPNCKELVWINCSKDLYQKYANLLPQHVLKSFYFSIPKDIESIRKIKNPYRGLDYYLQIMAYIISRDKIAIKDLEPHLDRKEILAIPKYLTYLDYKDAFQGWSLQEVINFVYSCPWDILESYKAQSIIDNHQKTLAPSLKNFIENYLLNSSTLSPIRRYADFKSFLSYHSRNPALDDLKQLIGIIDLELKAALPNSSFLNIATKLQKIKKSCHEEKILTQIKSSENNIALHLQNALLDLKNYYKNTLEKSIRQSLLPKNVIFQLINAANIRLSHLQNAAKEFTLDQSVFNSSFFEEIKICHLDFIHSNSMMADYLVISNSKELKADSTKSKENMNHRSLDSRELIGLQALRIPEKLQSKLSKMQNHFDLVHGTDSQLQHGLTKRGSSGTEKRLKNIEVVNNETIKQDFASEYRNLIGDVSVTHLQGDRPEQQDASLCSLLNLKFGCENHQIPLYGIFDGHSGKAGSAYLRDYLTTSIENKLNEVFKSLDPQDTDKFEAAIFNTFKTIFHQITNEYRKFAAMNSLKGGSCAIIAFVIKNKLWVVNLGDSRAVLSVNGLPIALSQDANLTTPEQQKTILKRDGFISNKRVNGQLNMSRSACEVLIPLNSRPEIVNIPLALLPPGPKSLCIACDGVFDALSSTFVAHTLYEKIESLSVDRISKNLVETAYLKGSTDNLSALVLDLNSLVNESHSFKEEGEEKGER